MCNSSVCYRYFLKIINMHQFVMKKLKICYHLFSFYHLKWLVLLDIDWTDNLVGCLFTIVEEDHIVALKSQGGFSGFDWANLNPQLTISVKPDIWMLIMIYIVAVMKTIYRNRAWIIFQVFVCVQSGTLIHDMHIHMHWHAHDRKVCSAYFIFKILRLTEKHLNENSGNSDFHH